MEYSKGDKLWSLFLYSFPHSTWIIQEPEYLPAMSNGYGAQKASLVAQMVKNLLAMQETCVLSLGCIDPLEKEIATHSSILAWRIPLTAGL